MPPPPTNQNNLLTRNGSNQQYLDKKVSLAHLNPKPQTTPETPQRSI